jgi:hypothetical protein
LTPYSTLTKTKRLFFKMRLSDFSSLLEIFTAFNFAFVLSDGFFKAIEQSFSHSKRKLTEQIQELNTHLKHCQDQLKGVSNLELNNGKSNTSKIVTHQTQLDLYKGRFSPIQERITLLLQTHENQQEFYPICLFSAFYCIIILLTAPLENQFKPFFLLFSILYLLWFIAARLSAGPNRSGMRFKHIFFSHYYSIYGIIGIVLGSLLFQLFYNLSGSKSFFVLFENYWEPMLYFIVLLPSFHFIYFYIKILQNRKQLCSKPLKEINTFSKEFHEKCFDPITKFVTITSDFLQSLEESTPDNRPKEKAKTLSSPN